MFIFHPYRIFFRHLKLEIALAISASNEWKIEANNLAWQGLDVKLFIFTKWDKRGSAVEERDTTLK